MVTYIARECPNCKFLMGFALTKPGWKAKEIHVDGSCFNCKYKIPVQKMHLGKKRHPSAGVKKSNQCGMNYRVIRGKIGSSGPKRDTRPRLKKGFPENRSYSESLRALGQNLDARHLKAFNLQCRDNFFLIWKRAGNSAAKSSHSQVFRKRPLHGTRTSVGDQSKKQIKNFNERYSSEVPELVYSPDEIGRLQNNGRARRRKPNGMPDDHSLGQILRTVGYHLDQKGARLLEISRRATAVSIAMETAEGRREIEKFRLDTLYTRWVRMYLHRSTRTLSHARR